MLLPQWEEEGGLRYLLVMELTTRVGRLLSDELRKSDHFNATSWLTIATATVGTRISLWLTPAREVAVVDDLAGSIVELDEALTITSQVMLDDIMSFNEHEHED